MPHDEKTAANKKPLITNHVVQYEIDKTEKKTPAAIRKSHLLSINANEGKPMYYN